MSKKKDSNLKTKKLNAPKKRGYNDKEFLSIN